MIVNIAATAAAAFAGAAVATVLRLPAAPLLGAMIGVAALTLSTRAELAAARRGPLGGARSPWGHCSGIGHP